jgi:uncharacterized membrane protein (UPF0127 family)
VSEARALSVAWTAQSDRPGPRLVLVNESTNTPIAQRVELAVSRAERRRGLLGRSRLDPGTALVLTPCFAVHTVRMQFPIDLVFVNRQGVAVRIVRSLRPWRIAVATGANAVIELTAGSIARCDLRTGDRVALVSRADGSETRVPLVR